MSQRLVKSHCSKFAGAVVGQGTDSKQSSRTGDRHDVTAIVLQHFRQKTLGRLKAHGNMTFEKLCIFVWVRKKIYSKNRLKSIEPK